MTSSMPLPSHADAALTAGALDVLAELAVNLGEHGGGLREVEQVHSGGA